MRKLLSIFTFAAFFATAAIGQISPVKWSGKALDKGDGKYEIQIEANIDKGWCIYSKDLKPGGPIPTNIKIDETNGVKMMGKMQEKGVKKEGHDKMFDLNLIKYYNKVVYTQMVKVDEGANAITASVKFMSCDDSKCLPPTVKKLTISLD